MVLRRPRLAPYNHQPPPVLSASSVHRFSSTSCWFRLRFINSILDHCIRCLLGLQGLSLKHPVEFPVTLGSASRLPLALVSG
ncbi:hypothetical protein VTN31DRAFT_7160 [Thermomyces dupontii]|uniref:uncharacterized protein n=1 Tax=Talaromyces thermophilus TaxID=28565 RepID=UPI00374440D6